LVVEQEKTASTDLHLHKTYYTPSDQV